MVTRADWAGLVSGRPQAAALSLVGPLHPAVSFSAAVPFLGLANDGQEWWVKAPFETPLDVRRATVTEYVVGRVGAVIGAPVCEVETILIPPALLPYDVFPGRALVAGIGSATRNLPGTVTEIRGVLNRRFDDDNRVRHAGVYALVDLFIGSDHQWLQRVDEDWELHSHDHGWFLPPAGPDWSEASLTFAVGADGTLPDDPGGIDADEVERLASALETLPRDTIRSVLNAVPTGMQVTDQELDCLGWFIEARAPQVAARLRALSV